MDTRAFLRAKTLEMQQRHVKYEDTPYALEPNCKESPGGLRDLQVLIWVARAAGLGRTWRELAANGLITPFEASQLVKHEGLLRLVRARLHMMAGRREDRLVFDLQTAVATSLGCRATKAQRASEVLMHRYYWAAKAVTQLNQILMLNIEERINASEAAPMRPINERFFDRGGMLEVARDDLYLERPARHPRDLSGLPADARAAGPVGAHAARAVQRARGDGRATSAATPSTGRASSRSCASPRPDARAAADEPDLGAGALPVGLPAHRRAHAARPVPRLHGGPAHPDGGAQRAPLLHPRARPRIPVLHPARGAVGPALGAVRGGDLPRRGQGPRRRPLRARRARGAALLPRARHRPRRRAADRVPGAPPPDDEPHRAEGRPVRRRRDRRFRAPGRHAGAADRAVPADGGRHPRHQPEGLECLEGQAAGGPVPPDAARARRRAAQPRRRDRGAQAGGAAEPGAALGAAGHRGAAVEDAGGELLRAPRRRRHRLARARAVAPLSTPRCRSCAPAPRRSATACRCWSMRPTAPTCSRASAATSTAPASACTTPRSTPRAPATRSTPSSS